MFGTSISPVDIVGLAVAVGVTLYMAAARNPHPEGSRERDSLRLCRVGLALAAWSFGFGLIGLALAVAAFVFGVLGVVKGRTAYGITVIVLSALLPALGVLLMFA